MIRGRCFGTLPAARSATALTNNGLSTKQCHHPPRVWRYEFRRFWRLAWKPAAIVLRSKYRAFSFVIQPCKSFIPAER
jgi:hypothetical protein